MERVLDARASEVRARIARERATAKARKSTPVKLSKMRSIAYYADLLGFHPETFRRWIKDGLIHAEYIGGAYRIAESEMMAFMERERLKIG